MGLVLMAVAMVGRLLFGKGGMCSAVCRSRGEFAGKRRESESRHNDSKRHHPEDRSQVSEKPADKSRKVSAQGDVRGCGVSRVPMPFPDEEP